MPSGPSPTMIISLDIMARRRLLLLVCITMQNIGMVMRSCQPLNAHYGAAESARR